MRIAFAAALFGAAAAPAIAQGPGPSEGADAAPVITLFTQTNLSGDVRELYDVYPTLHDVSFNDRARSLVVLSGVWEVCEDSDFRGRCAVVRRDVYDLAEIGLRNRISSVRPVYEYTDAPHGLLFNRDSLGRIRYSEYERDYAYSRPRTSVHVYYGHSHDYSRHGYYHPRVGYGPFGYGYRHRGHVGYGRAYGRARHRGYGHRTYGYRGDRRHHDRIIRHERPPLRGHYGARDGAATLHVDSHRRGPSLGVNRAVPDLSRWRFNDNASSISIKEGRWEVCEHANFRGRCEVIDASTGRLNNLRLNDNISSIRPLDDISSGDRSGRGHRGGGDGVVGRGGRGDRADRGGRGDRGERGRRMGDRRGGRIDASPPADALAGGRDSGRPDRSVRRFNERRGDSVRAAREVGGDIRAPRRVETGRVAPPRTTRDVRREAGSPRGRTVTRGVRSEGGRRTGPAGLGRSPTRDAGARPARSTPRAVTPRAPETRRAAPVRSAPAARPAAPRAATRAAPTREPRKRRGGGNSRTVEE